MEELRLPWNDREGLLYGGIIAAITAFLMMLINICRSKGGFELEYMEQTLIGLPLVWAVVMLLMTFLVGRTANLIVNRFSAPSDSVNVHIVLNIVCCVTMMSVIMTALGPLIGSVMSLQLNIHGFENWIYNWPINFCIAFWIEMLLAQPTARMVMRRKHIRVLKTRNVGATDE